MPALFPIATRHKSLLAALAVVTSIVLGGADAATANAQSKTTTDSSTVTNPYSPAYHHPYRHGVLPTIAVNANMRRYAASNPGRFNTAIGPNTLSFGGGIDGIGVQSGAKNKVYLVFYGTQWGVEGTDSRGDAVFSGDPYNAAPVAQEMFKGIGTGGEMWSATLTQWCDGPNVASGATSCPNNADFIPYQSGGVLAGVWYDNAAPSPSSATSGQLTQEATNAAAHFGNVTAASNRNSYYVILSPHGTNPDNYQNNYCAWHSGTGSSYGDIAFSNQPYNMDSGYGCGVGFVNSPGTLDGWTITLGHEWQEMMSDTLPDGGWLNRTGSAQNGNENADECAWISPGNAGGAADVGMGTGSFAEQSTWSNDTNTCAISHPIVHQVSCASPGVAVYDVDAQGRLRRWTYAAPLDGSSGWTEQTIGTGWNGLLVVAGGRGVLYTIDSAGNLHWYLDNNSNGSGGASWNSASGALIGIGWSGFTTVVSGGSGVIYAVDTSGRLRWYRYTGTNGSNSWAAGSGTVIGTGWNVYPTIVAGGSGVIYAATSSGTLMWYQHSDPLGGSASWANNGAGRQIGTGWSGFARIGSVGSGVIFARTTDGSMWWYRHLDPQGGSATWANNGTGVGEGTGWNDGLIADVLGCVTT